MSEGTTRQTKIRELAIAFLEEHLKMQYSSFHGTILDITEEQMALEIKAYLNGGIPWPIISSDVLKKLLIDFGQAAYAEGREDGLAEAVQKCDEQRNTMAQALAGCEGTTVVYLMLEAQTNVLGEAVAVLRSLSSKKEGSNG